jgi:hypothetical protein
MNQPRIVPVPPLRLAPGRNRHGSTTFINPATFTLGHL